MPWHEHEHGVACRCTGDMLWACDMTWEAWRVGGSLGGLGGGGGGGGGVQVGAEVRVEGEWCG